jgi:hemoglobin-like flavoprotein
MISTMLTPRRTVTGDTFIINGKTWLSSRNRIMVQVFVLSNGTLNIKDIATLIQQPEDVIQKAVQILVDMNSVNLLPEKRKYISNISFLKKTFDQITDKVSFAKRFYDIFLTVFPVVDSLFSKTKWENQYNLLMASIGVMIKLRYSPNLVPSLHLMGSRHDYYGVKPEHYIMFNASLLIALQQTLGVQFTTEEQDFWTSTVEIVSTEMLKGGRPEMDSLFSHILSPDK